MLGCHSSLQKPSNDTPLGEVDGGSAEIEVFDGPDNRSFPYICEEDTECNDDDLCTGDACVDGKCEYQHKPIGFDPVIVETAEPALDVLFADGRLFVAEGDGGVEVFTLNDADPPEFEAVIETEQPALSVGRIRGYLIVSEGENGIEVFSLSSLEFHEHMQADSNFIRGVDDVRGCQTGPRYTIVSGYADGVLVVDTSDGNVPLALLPTEGRAMRSASSHSVVVTADALGGAAVIAFNTPDGIAVTDQIPTNGRALDVDVSLDTAIVAEHGGGFSILDLSDPMNPERLVSYPTGSPVTMAGLIGAQTALIGEESGRLRLFDLSVQYSGKETKTEDGEVIPKADAAAPEEIDSWKGKGVPVQMFIRDGIVAVAMSGGGVAFFDTGCMPTEEPEDSDTATEE